MTIETIIKSVCENCNYYNKSFGVCGGEILPVERAILRNAEGRGSCANVKNFITKGENKIKSAVTEIGEDQVLVERRKENDKR